MAWLLFFIRCYVFCVLLQSTTKSTTWDAVEWCDCCSLYVVTSSVIYYSKEQKVQHEMKLSGVTVVLYTLWRLLWSITVHTRKNVIYLFHAIKIQMVYWRVLGHEKRKNNLCVMVNIMVNNQWECPQKSLYCIIWNITHGREDILFMLKISHKSAQQTSEILDLLYS